ncbi:U4/U5/U6 small nuclear ribonucleoprotein prp3 [Tilletia horrida]|nr:U4/U5/U6 small nuclear ribonucleoprotein prp3 [Tilletia horrida]
MAPKRPAEDVGSSTSDSSDAKRPRTSLPPQNGTAPSAKVLSAAPTLAAAPTTRAPAAAPASAKTVGASGRTAAQIAADLAAARARINATLASKNLTNVLPSSSASASRPAISAPIAANGAATAAAAAAAITASRSRPGTVSAAYAPAARPDDRKTPAGGAGGSGRGGYGAGGRGGRYAAPPPPRYGSGPAPLVPPPSGLLPPGSSIPAPSSRAPPAAGSSTQNAYLGALNEAEASSVRARSTHRSLQFNRPGRHIAAAEEVRREAAMEAIKKRIQEAARKAGMQDDLTGEEKHLKRPVPPPVEWWDEALIPEGKSYDDVQLQPQGSDAQKQDKGKAKAEGGEEEVPLLLPLIETNDSPIDIYIQHPIPIPPPNANKGPVEPRALMLTKREQKKLRRQRRAAELEDKRDRIKMGLLPPDPPKVKLSNLMRVLASESVADPTKVEAKVRRDVAARREVHEKTNAERKLTDEQRREKIQAQRAKEEAKGLFNAVFKIKHLVATIHKIKVRKNAEQMGLTGVVIFHPSFALVVVEGSAKEIKAYKHLMLNRIDWVEGGRLIDVETGNTAGVKDEDVDLAGGDIKPAASSASTAAPQVVDLSTNKCELIFEGAIRDRLYAQNMGFRARRAETDGDAREILGEKMKGYWDLAKRLGASGVKEEEEWN